MAKGQLRSNREKRKPKQDKKAKEAAKAPAAFSSQVEAIKKRDTLPQKGRPS
ncbi:hypothetical protein [Roseibium sp.]|uniref:hypothetical protein n=1 Tax=Roseibium sp. TaxID=1936156 RepID=UPI003A9858F8